MHPHSLISRYLHPQPDALARLGRDVFVATPLYRARRAGRPVYINRVAYQNIFAPAHSPSWEEMAQTLSILFSTTIEAEHGTGEVLATAYVDRQSDPLGLSLSGNLGSGRAYYAGAAFNIKGERTPLATAAKKQFSDGFLEMERALWETLVANGLQGAISTGLGAVLAVIDMDDTCTVGWREHPVKRAKIIRLDEGCLDRVTHLFQAPRALSAQQLHDTAACFGRLEADKFCQRIVHGTWSPGNISPAAHLIDFDTVSATKGRGPLYSSTRWYHQNRFGFEHGGQAAILAALAAHDGINRDSVSAPQLEDTLHAALKRQTALNFIALMGFDAAQDLYAQNAAAVDALCVLWQEIARKTYAAPDAFMIKDERAHHVHVFDTALFMGAYPLALRTGRDDPSLLLQMMTEDSLSDVLATPQAPPVLSDVERQHQDAVDAVIGPHMVGDEGTRVMLSLAALSFIKKYGRVFHLLSTHAQQDPLQVEARALARNEDRRALFPALTATFRVAENTAGRSARHIDAILSALIESCGRSGAPDTRRYRATVYDEGFFFIALLGDGRHQLCFRAHPEMDQPYEIKWENSVYPLDGQGLSAPRDNSLLWPQLTREASLQPPQVSLYSQNEHIKEDRPATPL